jgi:cell division protein FtsX
MLLREVAVAVAACAIALMVAASAGGSDPIAPTTFASAGIDCAPSAGATGQVFLKPKATDYEIITARLAIASVPGVTIEQYLDHQGAFSQLSCVFADAPVLVRSIHPVDLPVSFAITADVSDADSTAHLRAIPNVRRVVTPESWRAWWTSIG